MALQAGIVGLPNVGKSTCLMQLVTAQKHRPVTTDSAQLIQRWVGRRAR